MDEITLHALYGSIQKWQRILDGSGVDQGTADCPLCELFFDKENRCSGCPVRDAANAPGCQNTPYEKWSMHQQGGHIQYQRAVYCPKCSQIARDEVMFLIKLLPDDDPVQQALREGRLSET